MNRILAYKSPFEMTSSGHNPIQQGGFNPTLKIEGQTYHLIGSLQHTKSLEHNFLQIYFMGPESNQTVRRAAVVPGTNMES